MKRRYRRHTNFFTSRPRVCYKIIQNCHSTKGITAIAFQFSVFHNHHVEKKNIEREHNLQYYRAFNPNGRRDARKNVSSNEWKKKKTLVLLATNGTRKSRANVLTYAFTNYVECIQLARHALKRMNL